jgi:hypothetical protein
MLALLCDAELHYNPEVRTLSEISGRLAACTVFFALLPGFCTAQQPPVPPASGARILLLPRKLVTGERATLAVLDVSGKLTPGVNIIFSNGDKITTDATGRALFAAPLNPGTIYASIEGRAGRISTTILSLEELASSAPEVTSVPRVASLSDRMEILGHGFCGDADANQVTIGGIPALVLASSPAYLAVLPPLDMDPGPASIQIRCAQKTLSPFTVVFVVLELDAKSSTLAPGEHSTVVVHVTGSTTRITLEARNLAPEIATLTGGVTVRAVSNGGKANTATFELVGKQSGSFVISIRLVAPLGPPRP